ncbi:hypothetical protein AGABI1DRAFT_47085, partial [Agaricus bisporus var. burnettii JB137-S8]
ELLRPTLFVSNLPYTATSVDIQTLFSDIAPVRSAFVVTEHGTGVSKGVGYVSFAMKEDAEAAYQKISKEGISLVGRKLRAEWAEHKPKHKPKDEEVPASKPRPISHTPKAPHDPVAIRTIIISGLPQTLDAKQLWKKIRKYDGAEKVDWPYKSEDGTEDPSIAHALFSTPSAANNAVTKLHAHVFKGSLLSVALKKRLENLSKAANPAKSKLTDTKTTTTLAPSHASRLIVRNLPFDITEQDLRAVFLPYGPIHEIHIPGVEGSKTRTKGFAFVWMLSKPDAERAIEGCNGKLGQQSKVMSERTIVVDWAMSKNKWEEEKAKQEQEQNRDVKMTSEDEDEDESDEEGNLGLHSGDEDEDDAQSENEAEEDEPVRPQLPPPEVGTTLFVRNVPFTATDDELRLLFRSFGPLRYARITMDLDTGRSRGTGFACFWNLEDADKVIEQSDLLRKETTGDAPTKNPFVLPSILTPDPSASLAQSLVLHGRTLDVVRAVTRDQASKLKEDGEKARQKADKRNMYLLKEGVILPNSPLAKDLAPADLERRTNSHNARRALLKSNPSLYISRTRLSVRQIPLFVTERVLKRLALHAVRAFESEVKEGSRVGLTTDELTEPLPTAEDEGGPPVKKQKRFTGRSTAVKQTKIVRQQDRVDVITGKGRSKGYGFVEMQKHSDALRVLRWANCNPDIGPLFEQWSKEELEDLLKMEKAKDVKEKDDAKIKRIRHEIENGPAKKGKASLIVEFSIENVQVVQRRNTKQEENTGSKVSRFIISRSTAVDAK